MPETSTSATESIALEVGELLRERFGNPGDVLDKHVPQDPSRLHDLVTATDYAAEKLIVDRVMSEFPGAVVLAEEGGLSEGNMEQLLECEDLWLVDPLDGTINFAHNIPFFCTSIGRYSKGEFVEGTIHAPMLNETFAMSDGRPTFNGDDIRPSNVPDMQGALVGIGGTYSPEEAGTLMHNGCVWRRLGSAALSLCYVANGRHDLYVQWGSLAAWDWGVGAPIAQAAGVTIVEKDLTPFNMRDFSTWRGLRAGSAAIIDQLR